MTLAAPPRGRTSRWSMSIRNGPSGWRSVRAKTGWRRGAPTPPHWNLAPARFPNRKLPHPSRRYPIVALFGHALIRSTDAGWAAGYPQPVSTMGMNYKGVVRGAHCLLPPRPRLNEAAPTSKAGYGFARQASSSGPSWVRSADECRDHGCRLPEARRIGCIRSGFIGFGWDLYRQACRGGRVGGR